MNLDRIVDDDTVQITISSNPITFNLSLGEIKKVNLDNDSYYDLKVFLKDMTSYSADIVIALISEEIPEEASEDERIVKGFPKEKNILLIIFYVLIGIGILVLIFVLYLIIKKKKLVINLSIKLKNIRERRRKKREEKRRK
ncbi:unnamed protein product [marine sediment metagenome]|uniref:Uncharacterized protein n=1 Tax=marine sediment metagenome TaxID=412755 RepID=X0VW99_9ZZZZ